MLNKTKLISLYLRPSLQCFHSYRLLSLLSTNGSNDAKITVTNDGQTIVCLHPEKPFPYEHSRPIPESKESLKAEESVLKIQHRIDGQNIHSRSGPDLEELQMLTFTPKFKWERHRRLKRVLPKPPHPRKGI